MSAPALRILQVTHQGDIGGSTNSITWLTDGLARLGHEVFLCCREESLLRERFSAHPGVRVVPFVFGRNPLAFHRSRALARSARALGIDVVNAHASLDRHLTIQARHLFGGRFRLVHTRRNMPLSTGGRLQGRYFGAFTDRIIAVSERVAAAMETGGVPREKIAVVRNGIPLESYREVPEERVREARRSLSLPGGLPVVGMFARRKGQADLLRAMSSVERKSAILFLGIDRDSELEALRASLRLSHPVVYGGFRTDILPFYRILDVFVLPSLIEGFSLSILEAMACGLPVVCTNAGGNAEAVRDGVNGFLFRPGEIDRFAGGLRKLLDDEPLRAAIGKTNREEAFRRFDVRETVRKTEAVYLSLIDEGTNS
ncbi:MAG: glycosyltransferase family 4 protein [Candidatus Eisenbacteria bacterium]